MKKISTMLLALSLISLTHSCQDEELEVQTVSVIPVEQETIEEETPYTLDQIDDPLLVNQYDNLNSLSKTILKEKLVTLYSDKVDLINWDSVRLNTDYIYIEDQTTDIKTYRFLVDIPRIDDNFIPPLVNVRVNHDIVNNDLLSDLHINDENISKYLTFDLEGVVTNESSNNIVNQSARTGRTSCDCATFLLQYHQFGVRTKIEYITSTNSYSPGVSNSPLISSAPASVWLQYARQTGNSQILSVFGIVRVAGVGWNKEITNKYMNPPSSRQKHYSLYLPKEGGGQMSFMYTTFFPEFPKLKNWIVEDYYYRKFNYGYPYSVSDLSFDEHILKQSFIDSFTDWLYRVRSENYSLYQYYKYNPTALEKTFKLFASYSQRNNDPKIIVGPDNPYLDYYNYRPQDAVILNNVSKMILENSDISLIKAYVDGKISKNQLESIGNYELNIKTQFLQAVQNDPYLLIDTNSSQLPKWKQLAQHKAPISVQNKIDNLPHGWANNFEIQDISDASGTAVNMDYFAVRVTQLPINPSTKRRFSADEFLQYFRKKINSFVNNSRATFYPYCKISYMCTTETMLWNSNNPLGSIVYINIPGTSYDPRGDDGVVALTEFTNTHWNFMTMNAPYAGNHPVSGTRQFGYEKNIDGSYNFYVRGVDRIDSNGIENFAWWLSIAEGEWFQAFAGADRLWESFQSKMNGFVNTNGGKSFILTPVKERPDWDEVKDVLLGEKPVSDL